MIAVAADLHICDKMWRSRADLAGDSRLYLIRFAEALLHEDPLPEALILAGDIFDSRAVDGIPLEAYRSFLDKLDGKIPVWFITGNHDRGSIPITGVFESKHIKSTPQVIGETEQWTVVGLDWLPGADLKERVQQITDDVDLLVLHCKMGHLVSFPGGEDLMVEDIPSNVRNVVCGDIHIRDVTPSVSNGFVLSPGSLQPCNLSEGGEHGYSLISKEGAPVHRNIKTRSIIRYTVTESEDGGPMVEGMTLDECLSKLEPCAPCDRTLVNLRFPTKLTASVEDVMAKYREFAVFFAEGSSSGKLLTDEDLAEFQEAVADLSMLGIVDTVVPADKEEELNGFLKDLLKGDPRAVIDKHLLQLAKERE